VRFWGEYYGRPLHNIVRVFHRVILARPWTSYVVPAGELEILFREKLREMMKTTPELRAALSQSLPENARVPSLVELVSPEAVGEKLGPLFSSHLKELQELRKRRVQKIKQSLSNFVRAEDEDEEEE